MKRSLYITSSGTLQRKANTLCLETEEGKKYFPIEQVRELHFFGEVTLNKRLLEFLSQQEILGHFYNRYGYYVGSFYPREHYNSGYLILKQVEHYLDEAKRWTLARAFVEGALGNLQKVLRYYARRGKALESVEETVRGHRERVGEAGGIEALMQVEGKAREAYYQAFDRILENPEFAFESRTRRPPRNRLNALISFGNSLLYTAVLSEIYKTHLDPRIGYLHTTNFRRFTLNLDVAEVFKPILVDRTIFALVQRRQVQPKHFEAALGGIVLNEEGRRRFLQVWEEHLQSTFQHRRLKRKVSYRHLLRLELYKLEKHLIGEKSYAPFQARW